MSGCGFLIDVLLIYTLMFSFAVLFLLFYSIKLSKEDNAKLENDLLNFQQKERPLRVRTSQIFEERIAGYCPTCDGTVDIKLTCLVKLKGHRCSWCGQVIDLTGVDLYEQK